MVTLRLVVQSIKDLHEGKNTQNPLFTPDTLQEDVIRAEMAVTIMEAGTQTDENGKRNTTLMFVMRDAEGNLMYNEITGKLLEMLYSAYKAAETRFKDENEKYSQN